MHTLTYSYRQQAQHIFLLMNLRKTARYTLKGCIVLLLFMMPRQGFSQDKEGEDSVIIREGVVVPFDVKDTIPAIRKNNSERLKKAAVPLAANDTTKKSRVKTPRGATIRSAIVPGWGQVYNKKYWKLPLVYGALGITGYVFVDNIAFYKKIRFAYMAATKKATSGDTSDFPNVAPELRPLVLSGDLSSLRSNRNTFRQNIDYSVLFFIFFWGLNVLDATVDAHLKGFNVTDDLSLKIKPNINYNSMGVGLVLDIHKGKKKLFLADN